MERYGIMKMRIILKRGKGGGSYEYSLDDTGKIENLRVERGLTPEHLVSLFPALRGACKRDRASRAGKNGNNVLYLLVISYNN